MTQLEITAIGDSVRRYIDLPDHTPADTARMVYREAAPVLGITHSNIDVRKAEGRRPGRRVKVRA